MNRPTRYGAAALTGYLGGAMVGNVLGLSRYDLEDEADRALEVGIGVALVTAGVEAVRGGL